MKILVTGGSGFLGAEICRRLTARGHQVRSLQRGRRTPSPETGSGSGTRTGTGTGTGTEAEAEAETMLGDIRDAASVATAVRGCDAVIHTAALADVWGPRHDFASVNIAGTAAVLDACRHHGVTRLVNCSSASVVFAGKDLRGADESAPYPRRFLAPYPWSKARAEQLVLAANSPRLATVSLRPHLIWGEGDPHFVPALRRAIRHGRLLLPGTGSHHVDTVHVADAAEAHVLAVESLSADSPLAGSSYFITQGRPRTLAATVQGLLTHHGITAEIHPIPAPVARTTATLLELTAKATRRRRRPFLTRFLVAELTHAHWFDISAARRDLGYAPTEHSWQTADVSPTPPATADRDG
ncbi:NAD-dependent epimerase/dehydratase family protein [Streptomyces alanosinicus]|uniref:3-beta hydroxysteroid dehydrogenase n=1 Tax=Streptomyces alanosinicus TaxID=68171 RepID=A0A918YSY3_9ACTN|nr:NAD-dependent epimerase/dehydratase family protein [Streptomyces alanosinicus]GHE15388.1 3-beta hydroxysteroid dehydrogenase [Streptomyces alanosinicus]